jgi:adenine-specific DNA-methyltransferase
MSGSRQKNTGAYYTPEEVVRSLVSWAVRSPRDRMLDPACGDGRFLRAHARSVGVEQDVDAAEAVHASAPGSLIHQGDFFTWAASTHERFECAAGNPPFIRYQRFTGEVRAAALDLCARHGALFSALTSSWAPFLVATATLLKPGGRMSFVVPAEIGHAPYARPALAYLASHFGLVHVVAIREKLFPELSEDCWLLHAEGFGGRTDLIAFSALPCFRPMGAPPPSPTSVSLDQWRLWNHRLRPWLLTSSARDLYQGVAGRAAVSRLGDVASVGIGYVTGANGFFHLRPSDAERQSIPEQVLRPAVRNGRALAGRAITRATVEAWRKQDAPMLLLDLSGCEELPSPVQHYLESEQGREARLSYKCRSRTPWYVVPDVTVPDAFLSYMSGERPSLVANRAGCVATNSVHVVRLSGAMSVAQAQRAWEQPVTRLSCEVEGHPLGGGMLKLEPGEAARVVLGPSLPDSPSDARVIEEAIATMREWRHYA